MTGIVLVTHAGLGESLHQQAEIILGRSLPVTTVSVGETTDPDIALSELVAAIASSMDGNGALILTDLPGATPHNLALQAASRHQLPVVSGLSLPMLLKTISHASKPAPELALVANLGGRQGITNQ